MYDKATEYVQHAVTKSGIPLWFVKIMFSSYTSDTLLVLTLKLSFSVSVHYLCQWAWWTLSCPQYDTDVDVSVSVILWMGLMSTYANYKLTWYHVVRTFQRNDCTVHLEILNLANACLGYQKWVRQLLKGLVLEQISTV